MSNYTQTEIDRIISAICPHCAKGNVARFRPETNEFVHDFVQGSSQSHTLCLATHFRQSQFGQANG